jgi:hypothetical protein
VGRFITQLPAAVLSLAEQIETATGVNILSQFQAHKPPAQSRPAGTAQPATASSPEAKPKASKTAPKAGV